MSWRKQRKVKIFSLPIKKEIIKIDKDGNESVETISYEIKFIDSMRFIGTSLSKLVENLTEGIHEIKCKYCVWWPITANQNNNNNNKNKKN